MLLIHCTTEPHAIYSHYLAEILRLEGFVDYAEAELTTIDAATLLAHDLVLLPRCTPTNEQVDLLTHYVRQGGKLIAFLPAATLVNQFGLQARHRAIQNGYLHTNATSVVNQGLTLEPVQVIGPAVGWQLPQGDDTEVLATVQSVHNDDAPESVPGAVAVRFGSGDAIFISYDLPHTIARLRQGNPANADLSFAGLDGIYRPSELFVNQMNVDQMRLPQADLQTAWLARLIETLAPRPRLWYYPKAEQSSVMLMTSDDDWSTLEQFETLIAGLKQRNAHCSFYVVPNTHLTTDHMDRWAQDGHTFSVHPASEADVKSGLAQKAEQRHFVPKMLRENVVRHQQEFGRTPHTIRQHAVRWLGYVEAAQLLADLGIRMDLNYLSVHPFSLGYMAGSGRPLRFVATDGALIDCYQQPTLWTEEVLIHPSFVFSFNWTVERALMETDKIIQQAAQTFYTPVAINSHPVSFATYSSPLIEGCWDQALAQGMSILSADDWLAWTEARESVRFEFNESGFSVVCARPVAELTILLPKQAQASTVDGHVGTQRRWGQKYTTLTLRHLYPGKGRQVEIEGMTKPI